jgi:hypothetical protein
MMEMMECGHQEFHVFSAFGAEGGRSAAIGIYFAALPLLH